LIDREVKFASIGDTQGKAAKPRDELGSRRRCAPVKKKLL
jgi:hypothetical protein